MKNKKILKIRKSTGCLKWCDGKNCIDTLEIIKFMGKPEKTWLNHCKEANKIHKQILR